LFRSARRTPRGGKRRGAPSRGAAAESTQSSRNWPSSSDRGAGRNVAASSSGTCVSSRVIHRNASSVELSAQCKSSSATSTGPWRDNPSTRSSIASTTRNCNAPAEGDSAPAVAPPAIRRPTAARRGSAVRRERPPRLPHEPPRSHCSADASCRSPPHPRPTPSRPRRPSRHESGAQAPRAHARGRSIYLRTPATRRQPDRSTGDTQGRRCGRARRCRPREPDQRS